MVRPPLATLSFEYKRAYARECAPRIWSGMRLAGSAEELAEHERFYEKDLIIIAEVDGSLFKQITDAYFERLEELGELEP